MMNGQISASVMSQSGVKTGEKDGNGTGRATKPASRDYLKEKLQEKVRKCENLIDFEKSNLPPTTTELRQL